MQLTQLIRRTSPIVWIVALVPALVAGVGAFLTTTSAPGYNVIATVPVTAPSGSDTAATVTQTVDSFRSALATQSVLDSAASEAGIESPPEEAVATSRVGTSNLVDLSVTVPERDALEEFVPALVASANELLFASAQSASDADLEAAQEQYDEVQAEIEETSAGGLVIPLERYRAKASEVTQLRVALAAARARGGAEAAELSTALKASIKELQRLSLTVRDLDNLTFKSTQAQSRLADAERAVSDVDARLAAANDENALKVSQVSKQSTFTTVSRAVLAGVIVGLAVALGLVLLIAAFRRPDPASR